MLLNIAYYVTLSYTQNVKWWSLQNGVSGSNGQTECNLYLTNSQAIAQYVQRNHEPLLLTLIPCFY